MRPKLVAATKFSWDRLRCRWVLQAPELVLFPDDTAARIISLCDGSRTFEDIVDELGCEFDAPEDEIRRDTADLLQELMAQGVIRDDERAS